MVRSRSRADARNILSIRRLQAAEALMRLQEADSEARATAEREAGARHQVRVAADEWHSYLSSGVFRPDFAGALAGAIGVAEAQAEEAARVHAQSEDSAENARHAHSAAMSIEEGAQTLLRRLDRLAVRRREAREQTRLEENASLNSAGQGGPAR